MDNKAMLDNCVNIVNKSIADALNHKSKLDEKALNIYGFSTPEIRHLMNNLCSVADNYLEIGTYCGSTFCSSIYKNNHLKAIAIDNFSEMQDRGDIRGTLNKNIAACTGENKNVRFFDQDSFKFDLKNIEEKIDVYFYDGDHSFDAQRDALTYYVSAMNDVFIYLVDDWNDEPKVVRGTYAGIGLKENKLRLHKEWIFKTPGNCFPVWWNGFYVAVLEKL